MGTANRSHEPRQVSLFCACGRPAPRKADFCSACYQQRWYSNRYFGGYRNAVLERDASCCQACGSSRHVVVHHRHPGKDELDLLITVCAVCHNRLHRLGAIRKLVPDRLVDLWHEQHPRLPIQLQFPYGA